MIKLEGNTLLIEGEKLTGVEIKNTDVKVAIKDCDFTSE